MANACRPARALKDQTRAVLLAAFLGDFGLHHFYLCRPRLGILSMIFCWTGIPGVFASLEALRLAVMDAQTWVDRYNHGMLGKAVPGWLPLALVAVPFALFGAIVTAIYLGYDF